MTQNIPQLSLVVVASNKESQHHANTIAKQLGCRVSDKSDGYDLTLTVQSNPLSKIIDLELTLQKFKPPLKLFLDFNSKQSHYRKQSGGGKQQHIVRATGLHKNPGLRILDATAGLGSDAFVLACNSASITLVEQHPVLSLMLDKAIARAQQTNELADIAARMQVCTTINSIDVICSLNKQAHYDVIYLDPMYPSIHKKQAKAKKSMQIIQYLLQDYDDQGDQLLSAALDCGVKRVVVKRPTVARHLINKIPQSTIESTNTRYDIYIQH